MLMKGTYTQDSFLATINQRITGIQGTPKHEGGCFFFGSGVWRGYPIMRESGLIGVRLTTTQFDLPPDAIDTVEQALAILCGFEYQG